MTHSPRGRDQNHQNAETIHSSDAIVNDAVEEAQDDGGNFGENDGRGSSPQERHINPATMGCQRGHGRRNNGAIEGDGRGHIIVGNRRSIGDTPGQSGDNTEAIRGSGGDNLPTHQRGNTGANRRSDDYDPPSLIPVQDTRGHSLISHQRLNSANDFSSLYS